MDRFERWCVALTVLQRFRIYIPIWIDLKDNDCTACKSVLAIYIPIWIDLKVIFAKSVLDVYSNLHSNMDRFEMTSQTIMGV